MSGRDDDRIIREMLAPAVDDSVEALGFWLRRHRRLPLYQRSTRNSGSGGMSVFARLGP
jgi:hypothetical protein